MKITKMQATGNDFLMVDNSDNLLSFDEKKALAKRLCRRRVSFGADGMIFLELGENLYMDFYNSDGSQGEMCGNGARCFARFAYEGGYADEEMHFGSLAGIVGASRLDRLNYSIEMPRVSLDKYMEGLGHYIEIGNPGLPHLVVEVDLIDKESLLERALYLRHHSSLEKGANVNFYRAWEPVQVLTFERGVEDFTLACGTGVCSVFHHLKSLNPSLETQNFRMEGGELRVRCLGEKLELSGPTIKVYESELIEESPS